MKIKVFGRDCVFPHLYTGGVEALAGLERATKAAHPTGEVSQAGQSGACPPCLFLHKGKSHRIYETMYYVRGDTRNENPLGEPVMVRVRIHGRNRSGEGMKR